MSPERIRERCQYLIERGQGDEPIWTSAQMEDIVVAYMRVLDEYARIRTGIS